MVNDVYVVCDEGYMRTDIEVPEDFEYKSRTNESKIKEMIDKD